MAFKTTLLVCGLVLSVQSVYSQVIGLGNGFGNAFGSSYGAVGLGEVDITAIEIDSTGYGAAYGNGYGIGNGIGLGSGFGSGFGLAGAGLAGGLAGVGLGGVATNPAFLNLNSFTAGGVFPVTSIGPIVPAGLTVVSDNIIEGPVALQGQLPFLSAVAFEGTLPSGGSGVTQCGCGNGNIGIISETVGSAGPVVAGGLGGFGRGGLIY